MTIRCPTDTILEALDEEEPDGIELPNEIELEGLEWKGSEAAGVCRQIGLDKHPRWRDFLAALASVVHRHTWFDLKQLNTFINAPDDHVFWVRWRCWERGELLPEKYRGTTEDC